MYIEAEFKLANLYKKIKIQKKQKNTFRKVLELDPENVGALSELADINRDMGNNREAQKLYNMAY